MIEKLKITASDTAIILKINELVEAVNELQKHIADTSKKVADRMIGCTTLDIPESYKNDQLTLATLDHNKSLQNELERIRKALDVAVKRLGYIKDNYKSWTLDRDAQMIAQAVNGLDEIKTALEQKEG